MPKKKVRKFVPSDSYHKSSDSDSDLVAPTSYSKTSSIEKNTWQRFPTRCGYIEGKRKGW